MKTKENKLQATVLCNIVIELASSLGWFLFLFMNNDNQLLVCLGMQAIYNLFYQEYLWNIYERKHHSLIWLYRLIYTITILSLLYTVYYFCVNRIDNISSIGENFVAVLLFFSLLMWILNTFISLFRVTERGVRVGTLIMVIGVMLGLFEMILNVLRVQFVESIIIIIFLMKIVSFSIEPKNAKLLYKCKLSSLFIVQKYNGKYRKKTRSLIDLLILSMTTFRFICKRTILNTFIFKFGYFEYIHFPGLKLMNNIIFLVNISINVVLYFLLIAVISIIICSIGIIINWLYNRFINVLLSIKV